MNGAASFNVSVRDLSEFVWRRGDLGRGRMGPSGLEGARAHRWLQAERKGGESEVFLSETVRRGASTLTVSGRADLIHPTSSPPRIEEIKTTLESPLLIGGENTVHWAQAKLYGHMYAGRYSLEALDIVLTYLNVETHQLRSFEKKVSAAALAQFFDETTGAYLDWMDRVTVWRNRRNATLENLSFPFERQRPGQAELSEEVTEIARNGGRLFVEAPTGSGKTMAVLFGGIKRLGTNDVSQVLFLSAKTVGQTAALSAVALLHAKGALLKAVSLHAKDRVCAMPAMTPCNGSGCPLAKGHFDRLRPAMADLFSSDSISDEAIARIAGAHDLCPYWLGRAVVPYVDVVIGDYNYFFDPRASLAALTTRISPPRLLLLDEAHNLPDRAREMFSATIDTGRFAALLPLLEGRLVFLRPIVTGIIAAMSRCVAGLRDNEARILDEAPENIVSGLERLTEAVTALLSDSGSGSAVPDALLSAFFDTSAYLRALGTSSEADRIIIKRRGSGAAVSCFCLDPSTRLRNRLEAGNDRVVFFSATLSPIAFYRRLLGGNLADRCAVFPSIFPPENRFVGAAVRPSTRYRDRVASRATVAELIQRAVLARPGNYLVFFPSFAYLSRVAEVLDFKEVKVDLVCQRPGMTEKEKQRFLSGFRTRRRSRHLLGLAVLGGLFGEGVDLPGNQLIGAVVVSPGLPKVTFEQELIRRFFAEKEGKGFEFAYLYPGMNKVVQAAGRVIRSRSDKGVLLFIGERFANKAYAELLTGVWSPICRIAEPERLTAELDAFWRAVD